MKTNLHGIAVLAVILTTPAFSQMLLLSETRNVTVSYYGTGVGSVSSDGNFGLFEASAVGIPFGGGSMTAYQKSSITTSEISIRHFLDDYYGPGGYARSSFELRFSLLEDARMTMIGYCSNYSGFVSLTSDLAGPIPVVWGNGHPLDFYRNDLNFDKVLSAGTYTLISYETPRDAVSTRILINVSSVPDGGLSAVLLGFALLGLGGVRRWMI